MDELLGLETAEQIQKLADELGVHPGIPAAIRAYGRDQNAWRLAAKLRRKLDTSTIG